MKKIIAFMLAVATVFAFAGCSKKEATEVKKASDFDYITKNGKLVVGVTEYEPMDFKGDDGEWTGFDAEFATAVAKKMDIDVEFVEIDWDNKWAELSSKKVDCIWNGMTITDEAKKNSSVSNPYVINAQVVVVKADKADSYKDAKSLKGLTLAVESGSAGQEAGADAGLTVAEYGAQTDALMAVASGKADGCIIDITMATAMTGEGTSYADLKSAMSLTEEEYGVSFRKNSDMTAKFNKYMDELKEDGTLNALAEKYSLTLAD